MLVENSLKNDLQSQNQYIAGLACCSIGNIASPEICRDLSPEVEKLMVGSNPFVAKKAALCSIRILRKCPELVDTYIERVGTLLGSRNHAVLLTSLKLMREMCLIEPAMVEQLRRHTSTLIAALKNLVLSGYAPEHDVHGIVDPFLQVEILRMLRILGTRHAETSDQMNDILAQVATNTESAKNAGNAILYECVLTIMAIEVESIVLDVVGLRDLAVRADQITDPPRNPGFEILLAFLATSVVGRPHGLVRVGQEHVGEAFVVGERLLIRHRIEGDADHDGIRSFIRIFLLTEPVALTRSTRRRGLRIPP